jgi:hypothetical protein
MSGVYIPHSDVWLLADSHFVTSECDSKAFTFLMIQVQKVVTDIQTVMPMPPCELFWNPACTNFMKVEIVMNYVKSAIRMTYIPFVTSVGAKTFT